MTPPPTLYLLDTNICIYTMNRRPEAVRRRLEETAAAGHALGLSSVTWHELWYGVRRSAQPEANAARLGALAGALDLYPFGDDAAERAARIRAELSRQGRSIGPYDVLIAGHALSLGATLVTHNVGEFGRVQGLSVEDWVQG
ncbi:type II toxin-antitoxin system VapC family toxin [Deinococcus sp. NW-56]|uniref:type II toxin-antitoxin system tRNA(fMet)-specific endonuclease VapC n=1 Tax=Deinococcus sp. NW-56 TaxID=2080419 RepID=UPI000CF45A11|nr:type II toxin-antitoxin system VapC family toxin [Deinococcus sp. NW-56]